MQRFTVTNTSLRHTMSALAFALLAACTEPSSTSTQPPTSPSTTPPTCDTTATAETVRIYEGLRPACVGCHVSGSRGYFASVETFQSLIVADPAMVTPGDGENAGLVALLRGTARGAFAQMPPAGPTWEQLARDDETLLSVDEVIAWIDGLETQVRDQRPDPSTSRLTRLSAEQIRVTLYQQLGLDDADFFRPALEFGIEMAEPINEGRYPLKGPDTFPAPRQKPTAERHAGLGGGSVLQQRLDDRSASPNFVHTLVQLSQAWCRQALEKDGNVALFPTPALRDADDDAVIAETLQRWSLLFHSQPLSDGDEATYRTLYAAVRAEEGNTSTTAWTAVCSAFIRHPLWVYY